MSKVVKISPHIPDYPAHFTDVQKEKWISTVSMLVDAGVWRPIDTDALQVYVENWVNMAEAMEKVNIMGPVIEENGRLIRNPWAIAYEKAFAACKPFMEQFGMTPRARQAIIVQEDKTKFDPLADL
jgi:P27 family predicted phage terminase small subunit